MPIDFWSSSYRASSTDLAVAISPLGLVELADEEFEVHGPRLNRYAACWAWYLGHHHSQRREMGEQNITLNYIRTLSDYITNFTFGKPIQFRCPEENSAIIPRLLHDVWEVDNNKQFTLWEMGQLAGVTGDCFVKVAFENEWIDPIGILHPSRIRIIPINPAHAFPEYNPHDRDRLQRFKLKYRFWGTAPEGTRQVFTFVEIITDDMVEQYINDELIDSYPNPIGTIPIVHIPNSTISSSPWGQSDIWDVISINREMNEKMTEVSDIVNYHAAPVTVITGAKASQLERGAKKVWAGLPKDAQVFNLESSGEMSGALEFIALLKQSMHEITGVPESALGQAQPISNTSGVALAIQYQPMMNRYSMKKIHFAKGLEKINELVIRTAAIHRPESLIYTPGTSSPPEEGQLTELNPEDFNTYRTSTHWPEPLPVDVLIKLNEVQVKMSLGLESKRGALRILGEEFPNEKIAEIYEELRDDAFDQGALDMIQAKIAAAVMKLTGTVPTGDGGFGPVETTSAGGSGVNTASGSGGGSSPSSPLPGVKVDSDVVNQLTTRAFGGQLAQYRVPEPD